MSPHRLEHRKNGIRGVETVWEYGQTAYVCGETSPRTACLNAQLKFWSFSELFMGLIFFWFESKDRKMALKQQA